MSPSPSEFVTEFVMSPQASQGPESLGPNELTYRAKLLEALSHRLVLFGTQRLAPSQELCNRVRDLLRRYGDIGSRVTLRPHSPLSHYFRARFALVTAARVLGIDVK